LDQEIEVLCFQWTFIISRFYARTVKIITTRAQGSMTCHECHAAAGCRACWRVSGDGISLQQRKGWSLDGHAVRRAGL